MQWEFFTKAGRTFEIDGARYIWLAGTSTAAPHVTGTAALVKQLHPNWQAPAINALLRSTASPLACPVDWPADDPRQCTGGPLGSTSF